MDYDLTRLGTRDFEHLTQALALHVLGANLTVFGDGPDGGREATFDGKIRWSSDEIWDGHTVIQAKFRQRLVGTDSDTAWFLAQVRDELKRWADPELNRSKKGLRPEYLLFSTNVVLSGVPETGGIDKLAKLIERYAKRLGFRGWQVWHHDQMCRLIDNNSDVRSSFKHLITPGDVVSRLHDYVDGLSVDLGEAMATHVEMDMLADRWVRLSEAGDPLNDKVELARIAVDLPAQRPVFAAAGELVQAVRYVIDIGDRIDAAPLAQADASARTSRHLVLVGGPGQGKSTLGQLICQTYRVALLADTCQPGSESAEVAGALQQCFDRIGVTLPIVRRWPFRVELATYADAIAGGERLSLLRYIAQRIAHRIAAPITSAQLLTWLGSWPWLLVLDGLDEVAAASTRDDVMQRIGEFLVEARRVDADLMIVATTRPQGYAGEFNADRYEHLTLTPLEPPEAIAYAERLAEVRHAGDQDLREAVVARMRLAAQEAATARLMRSPLQVTIMSLLLEARERAPQARYALFDAYYNIIYAREVAKTGPIPALLKKHRRHIDALHDRVGLLLQVQAEKDGEADASLPRTELRALAIERLTGEGHDLATSQNLSDQIITAATRRLVLLVAKGLDDVGFEVRSLQEFMAARALATGPDTAIIARLRCLAPSAHWRNTWLFAAGRIFDEREYLRDGLIAQCRGADVGSQLHRAVMPGTDLALDLLNEGIAAGAPNCQRMLTQHALAALAFPVLIEADTLASALFQVADDDRESRLAIQQEIEATLSAGQAGRITALRLLLAWRERTGALAVWARQRYEQPSVRPAVAERHILGSFGHPRLAPAAARQAGPTTPLTPAGTLKSIIQPLIDTIDLADQDAAVAQRLVEQMSATAFARLGSGDSDTLVVTKVVVPDQAILADALSRPQVADAFASVLRGIESSAWAAAMTLRMFLRIGLTRLPESDAALAVTPFPTS